MIAEAESRDRTPRMVIAGYVFAIFFSLLFVAWGSLSLRTVGDVRQIGWTWALSGTEWVVQDVTPGGPADGLLAPGDRILALDGDDRIGRIGPEWIVSHAPVATPYAVTVERDGASLELRLRQRRARDDARRVWLYLQLLAALSYATVAVLIIVARPEEEAIRSGFWGAGLISLFYLWQASDPYDGLLRGTALDVQFLLGSTFPLYLWGGYRFFAAFPENRPEEGRWRIVLRVLFVGAWAIWLPRTILAVVQIPEEATVGVLHAVWPIMLPYVVFGPWLETLFLVGILAASAAVIVRNYRRLEEGDSRRRIRWVAVATITSSTMVILASFGDVLATSVFRTGEAVAIATRFKVFANAVAMTMPLAVSYAIVRHRVMGIELVVRLGLRYLMAKTVLQAAIALPAVWLAWRVASSPDATVSELLFRGAGRSNLAVIGIGAVLLRYRRPVREALDRRFFREAYDQDQILIGLTEAIKRLGSVQEIARTVSVKVDAALHVDRVVILFRNEREARFVVGYSTEDTGIRAVVPERSGLLQALERGRRPVRWSTLRTSCDDEERAWGDRLKLGLIVPILGVDDDLVGVLLLGDKRSEEPYTPRDRALLQALTAQVGAVYEVLGLRERVRQERKVRTEVLEKLDRDEVTLMKECPTCGRCYDHEVERCPADGAEVDHSLPVSRIVAERYRLERALGRGAMGAVFQADDLRLGRQVAIKIMMGSLFGDASAQRRFAREAHASARLVHPNIVRVYDFGELPGEGAYLVMELVHGRTWRAMLADNEGVLPPASAVVLIGQLLDGMETAHGAGVVHRDLKPDNLLLEGEGSSATVKILDFGLAKVRELGMSDPKSRTATGIVMGTLGYMSPEQFFGDDVDERADVYSMSVIAFESLTGPLPKRGYAVHELIRQELETRLGGASASSASEALRQALEAGLAWEPGERLGSVAELRASLVPALQSWERRSA